MYVACYLVFTVSIKFYWSYIASTGSAITGVTGYKALMEVPNYMIKGCAWLTMFKNCNYFHKLQAEFSHQISHMYLLLYAFLSMVLLLNRLTTTWNLFVNNSCLLSDFCCFIESYSVIVVVLKVLQWFLLLFWRLFNGPLITRMIHHHQMTTKTKKREQTTLILGIKNSSKLIKGHFLSLSL